jgi:hypothetical protein
MLRVPNFFEDVALIVEAGSLDLDLAWRAFGDLAIDAWEYWEPAILVLREDDPDSYAEFAGFVEDLKEYEPRRKPRAAPAARAR